jgi:hypothetical protein
MCTTCVGAGWIGVGRWPWRSTEYKRHPVKHPGCHGHIADPVMLLDSIVVLNKPDPDGPTSGRGYVRAFWQCLRSLAQQGLREFWHCFVLVDLHQAYWALSLLPDRGSQTLIRLEGPYRTAHIKGRWGESSDDEVDRSRHTHRENPNPILRSAASDGMSPPPPLLSPMQVLRRPTASPPRRALASARGHPGRHRRPRCRCGEAQQGRGA